MNTKWTPAENVALVVARGPGRSAGGKLFTMNNLPEQITMRAGIVSVNGQPVLRFASVAQAGIFLSRLDYRAQEFSDTWRFYRPTVKRPDVLRMMLAAAESFA